MALWTTSSLRLSGVVCSNAATCWVWAWTMWRSEKSTTRYSSRFSHSCRLDRLEIVLVFTCLLSPWRFSPAFIATSEHAWIWSRSKLQLTSTNEWNFSPNNANTFFSTASYFPSLSCLLRRMTSVSTAEASTGYPGQLVAMEAVQRSRCKGHHGWTQLRTETTKPPLHEQRETVKPCFLRQLQENRFCSTRVLSAFGALFCRPWVKGCYWYAVHPPKLNMWVPIRRATQKSDSSRFRVSGFGFRRLKPTFAVGFGFRVSGFVDWNPLSLLVSDFGFRVSGFVDWNPLSLSVSGFGFRVSSLETNFRCRFRVSGLGFRRLKPTFAVGFGFRVWGFVAWNQLSLSVSGFGFRVSSLETNFRCRFRVSGFVAWNQLSLSVSDFGIRVSGFVDWS